MPNLEQEALLLGAHQILARPVASMEEEAQQEEVNAVVAEEVAPAGVAAIHLLSKMSDAEVDAVADAAVKAVEAGEEALIASAAVEEDQVFVEQIDLNALIIVVKDILATVHHS